MKHMLLASGFILASASSAAQAQVTVDVSKITCEQFVGYKITNPRNISMWLSGYYNGKRGNTMLDTQGLGPVYIRHCSQRTAATMLIMEAKQGSVFS
jgi:hypothetical protein